MIRQHRFTFLLLVGLLLPTPAVAQITLDGSNLPRPGDSLISWFVEPELLVGVSPGSATPGTTWNFARAGWESGFARSRRVVLDPAATALDSAFPSATIALSEREVGANGYLNEGLDYIAVTADRLSPLGSASIFRAAGSQRTLLAIDRTSGLDLPLPVTVGASWSIAGRTWVLQTPLDSGSGDLPVVVARGTITRSATVDAWGTVITPFGAWSALRVHELSVAVDSIVGEGGEIGDVIIDSLQTFDWYIEPMGMLMPVVSMEVYQDTVVSLQLVEPVGQPGLGVERGDEMALGLWPNPTTGPVRIEGESGGAIEIFDLSGRIVARWSTFRRDLRLDALPSGSYLLRRGGVTRRLEIRR